MIFWDKFLYELWNADLLLNGKNAGTEDYKNSDQEIFKN
jgi:hypothetical protein